jgi:hypothetical protein
MIKRIISQSGTGLAPWSINHQPMKLIERLSNEFHCKRANEAEMFECIHKLLEYSRGDFYRLHLSLTIGKKCMSTRMTMKLNIVARLLLSS